MTTAYVENMEPEVVPIGVGADDALYDVQRQGQHIAQQHLEVLGLVLLAARTRFVCERASATMATLARSSVL
jgi:hypothetical protein